MKILSRVSLPENGRLFILFKHLHIATEKLSTFSQMTLQALEAGAKAISEICVQIQEWASKIGKPKRTDLASPDTTFDEEVLKTSLASDIKDLYSKNLSRLLSEIHQYNLDCRAVKAVMNLKHPFCAEANQ